MPPGISVSGSVINISITTRSSRTQVDFYAYLRINENWGVSVYEQYEFSLRVWQSQRYMIHRDLSSWVASLGAQVRESEGQGEPDLGILFVLTLKDARR
jgi:hypothetical protein